MCSLLSQSESDFAQSRLRFHVNTLLVSVAFVAMKPIPYDKAFHLYAQDESS